MVCLAALAGDMAGLVPIVVLGGVMFVAGSRILIARGVSAFRPVLLAVWAGDAALTLAAINLRLAVWLAAIGERPLQQIQAAIPLGVINLIVVALFVMVGLLLVRFVAPPERGPV